MFIEIRLDFLKGENKGEGQNQDTANLIINFKPMRTLQPGGSQGELSL